MMLKEKTTVEKNKGKLKEGFVGQNENINGLAVFLISILCGAVFSGAFGGRSTVSVCTAFAAVLSPFSAMCAYMGCLTAYLMTGTAGAHIAEIAAMPLLASVQLFYGLMSGKKLGIVYSSASALVGYSCCGIIAAFTGKITAVTVLAAVFRGVVCGAAAYFLRKIIDDYNDDGKLEITGEKGISTAVGYAFSVAALGELTFDGINLGFIAGAFVILCAAGRFSCTGAAAAGAITSLGMLLGEVKSVEAAANLRGTVILSCAGIACALVSKKSKLIMSVGFIGASLVLLMFSGSLEAASKQMICVLIAAGGYSFIPDRLYMRAVGAVSQKNNAAVRLLRRNISCAAESVRGVIGNMDRANEILEKAECQTINTEKAYDTICRSCRVRCYCCGGDAEREKQLFSRLDRITSKNGFITVDMLPSAAENCDRKQDICNYFNSQFRKKGCELHLRDVNIKMREVAFEQLSAAEDMLENLCGAFFAGGICDEILSDKVNTLFSECGLEKAEAAVFFDDFGRIFISCMLEKTTDYKYDTLAEKLSEVVDRELEAPEIYETDGSARLCFHGNPTFDAEIGIASAKGCDEISGDCSAAFGDGFGNIYFIISDGMGSGSNAAAESLIAVSLMKRLIRAGCGINAAVRTTNVMLLTKSSSESFATLDMLVLNVFSGQAVFVKLGAAVSFLSSGGMVHELSSVSMPLGIVSCTDYEKRSVKLCGGDVVLMTSDGIGECFYPKVRELIQSSAFSAQQCADRIILDASNDKNQNILHADDKTVIVVKMHKNI